MNSEERLQIVYSMHKQAEQSVLGVWGDTAAAGADTWKGRGLRMIPGVGGALSLGDAANSFSKGRIWGGLGHLGMSALGFIPGGGALGMGIKGLAKGIGTVARGIGGGIGKMLPTAAKTMGWAAKQTPTMRNAAMGIGRAAGNVATLPGKVYGGTNMAKYMGRNEGKAQLVGFGTHMGAGHMQGLADDTANAYKQTEQGMQNMLQQIHQKPVFTDPMHIQPSGSVGSDLANQFLN